MRNLIDFCLFYYFGFLEDLQENVKRSKNWKQKEIKKEKENVSKILKQKLFEIYFSRVESFCQSRTALFNERKEEDWSINWDHNLDQ